MNDSCALTSALNEIEVLDMSIDLCGIYFVLFFVHQVTLAARCFDIW